MVITISFGFPYLKMEAGRVEILICFYYPYLSDRERTEITVAPAFCTFRKKSQSSNNCQLL
jgi:hypothetical protein